MPAAGVSASSNAGTLPNNGRLSTAMTKPKPLALSANNCAKGLPPGWHDRFVDAVADELLLLDNVIDADVNHAVTVAPWHRDGGMKTVAGPTVTFADVEAPSTGC